MDGRGVPLGLAVAGANVNDFKLLRETIESIPVARSRPRRNRRQGLCLDKGYDYDEVRELLTEFGFTAHIRSRGAETQRLKRSARFKARRWVCERTALLAVWLVVGGAGPAQVPRMRHAV